MLTIPLSLIDVRRIFVDDLVARLHPPEPRFHSLAVPVPKVLTPSQRQPVQPLDEDLPYIPEFLRTSSIARAVVATRCKFGWERLSVDCLCLYVDAEDTTSLENSIRERTDLVIIKKTKLHHAADSMSAVQKLLAPTGLSNFELRERRYTYRKKSYPTSRQATWPHLSWTVHITYWRRIEGFGWDIFISLWHRRP